MKGRAGIFGRKAIGYKSISRSIGLADVTWSTIEQLQDVVSRRAHALRTATSDAAYRTAKANLLEALQAAQEAISGGLQSRVTAAQWSSFDTTVRNSVYTYQNQPLPSSVMEWEGEGTTVTSGGGTTTTGGGSTGGGTTGGGTTTQGGLPSWVAPAAIGAAVFIGGLIVLGGKD